MTRSSTSIGFSVASTLLLAIMPKCPVCWIALVSAVGLSWPISAGWLRSLTIAFSLVPLGLLLWNAHRSRDYRPLLLGMVAAIALNRSRDYRPLLLGMVAAIALYVCKFRLGLDSGAYLSAAVLFGATLWGAKLRPARASDIICGCFSLEVANRREIPHSCASVSHTSSEVLDG